MAVKRIIPNSEGVYFITFTCFKWINLIDIINAYDLIYKWFDYLKQEGHLIVGYVIMPNHIHVIIAFRNTGKNINTIVGNGKRFIAYEIINRLKEIGETDILRTLEEGVNKSDKKRGKKHEVWQSSFDWKECITHEIIVQKLGYMHKNPCKGKWQLAEGIIEYSHSSALYYITGTQGVYCVSSYMELSDVDLTILK